MSLRKPRFHNKNGEFKVISEQDVQRLFVERLQEREFVVIKGSGQRKPFYTEAPYDFARGISRDVIAVKEEMFFDFELKSPRIDQKRTENEAIAQCQRYHMARQLAGKIELYSRLFETIGRSYVLPTDFHPPIIVVIEDMPYIKRCIKFYDLPFGVVTIKIDSDATKILKTRYFNCPIFMNLMKKAR